jgi:hypothetical protein
VKKTEFLDFYHNKSNTLIGIWFDEAKFLADHMIKIQDKNISLTQALDIYLPKYIKAGKPDRRPFEEQIGDRACTPIKIKQAITDLSAWGLESPNHPPISELWPVPVGYDVGSGKRLLIDSCHTICSLAAEHKNQPALTLRIVEISGSNLDELIGDFRMINKR